MEGLIGIFAILSGLVIGFLIGKLVSTRRILATERKLATLETEKRNLEEQFKNHRENIGQLQTQFENLANKILDQKAHSIRETQEKNLSVLLKPLKEKIQEFQKKVEETYSHESRERFALKKEIEKIVEANQQITQEANNLTKALRGDVKAQGNWGEIVLERILEASGLRKDQEYTVQGKDMGLADSEGKRLRPDVIVHLPEDKHIIVDSKVSLVHYDRYIGEIEKEKKATHLKAFLDSIHGHTSELSQKSYQNLEGLRSPEFVFMFVPIEGAYSLAVQVEPNLFSHAWDKKVIIVTPSTLLSSLWTVASIWKQERQNRHAFEIARQSGNLYDKFVGFVADLLKVGDHIEKTKDVYSDAMNKLKTGKGNIISRVEQIKKLGAKTSKDLPTHLVLEKEAEKLIAAKESPLSNPPKELSKDR